MAAIDNIQKKNLMAKYWLKKKKKKKWQMQAIVRYSVKSDIRNTVSYHGVKDSLQKETSAKKRKL